MRLAVLEIRMNEQLVIWKSVNDFPKPISIWVWIRKSKREIYLLDDHTLPDKMRSCAELA